MDNEKFRLWKLALGIVHSDGKMSEIEKEWFSKSIGELQNQNVLDFTEAQLNELAEVLLKPIQLYVDEFKSIRDPNSAARLIFLIRQMKTLHPKLPGDQQKVMSQMESACLEHLDSKQVEASIQKMKAPPAAPSVGQDLSMGVDSPEKQDSQAFFQNAFISILQTLHPELFRK